VTLQTAALVQADAQLSLTSSPAGAAVSLDGKYLGDTPLELDLASKAGQRLLVLAKGYRAAREQLNLPTGKVSAKHIVLERLIGDLRLETRPSDALVRVNDEALDTLNGKQNLALPLQPYEVEVTREGYAGFTTTVYPIPGVEQTLRVKLLTLEEARLAAIRPEFTDKAGHLLRIQNADQVNMGASRREPGRRANETMRTASFERLFYLADREVTNAQFRAFASGHDSGKFDEISLNENDQPVTGISWHDAAAYCNWLSEQEELEPFYEMEFAKVVAVNANALGYRLPTEAEWAWAARRLPPELSTDGNQLRFAWGDSLPPPTRFENYADRSAANKIGRIIFAYNDNYTVAAPVGSYAANHRKLYDMGGNVAEWVHDYYEIPDDTAVNDSLGPTGGEYHVIRGASWMHGTITELRLSFRDYGIDGRQDLGFRVARYAE
jgi:formylglycine-generating enzyme required for sulfatase activity